MRRESPNAVQAASVAVLMICSVVVGGITFAERATANHPDVNPSDLEGSGTEDDPFVITTVPEFQAMEDDLDADYVLRNDIDASRTVQWDDRSGFDPVDATFGNEFTGSLYGNNRTITGLTINRSSPRAAEIFARSDGALEAQQSGPTEISNWIEFDSVREDLDGDYVLINDLNESTPGYGEIASASANGGSGFDPIGDWPAGDAKFTGTFDGKGHTISGLVINRSTENNIGLFGTAEAAELRNVTLVGVNITGSEKVGGLVGRTRPFFSKSGTVENVAVSGTVTGSEQVGGLIGLNFDGTVTDSEVSANVTGSRDVGGLVGDNSGTVSVSEASGDVTGDRNIGGSVGRNFRTVSNTTASGNVTANVVVGGLVGSVSSGTVSNATASGDVTGSEQVGGLVGRTRDGNVSESFAVGAVTGSESSGGLVGQLGSPITFGSANEPVLADSYYDNQTTGQNDAVGKIIQDSSTNAELRGIVTGLETSQMQGQSAQNSMARLDFETVWETRPDDYPELSSSTPDSGDGDKTDNFMLVLTEWPTELEAGDAYSVTVEVTNVGGSDGEQDITYELERDTGDTVLSATEAVSLTSSESRTVTFDVASGDSVDLNGSYMHVVNSVDDEVSRDIKVTDADGSEDPSIENYADGDGTIGPSGLGDAAADFRDGTIGPRLLGDIASAFRTGERVT